MLSEQLETTNIINKGTGAGGTNKNYYGKKSTKTFFYPPD